MSDEIPLWRRLLRHLEDGQVTIEANPDLISRRPATFICGHYRIDGTLVFNHITGDSDFIANGIRLIPPRRKAGRGRGYFFELPEDATWRHQNMTRICAWLKANGVEPADVPIDSPVICDDRNLAMMIYVRDAGGRLTLDSVDGESLRKRSLVTPLKYRWEDPRPLPRGIGSAYARRRRHRR